MSTVLTVLFVAMLVLTALGIWAAATCNKSTDNWGGAVLAIVLWIFAFVCFVAWLIGLAILKWPWW